MPLEYGTNASDPFQPVIRAIALMLVLLAVLELLATGLQLVQQFANGFTQGPTAFFFWILVGELPSSPWF
jgi:hypothetical protein